MGPRALAVALTLVCFLSALTVALVTLIENLTGEDSHRFLLWNLFLAWVPLMLSLALERRRRDGIGGVPSLLLGAGWLLFLPNAPYLVTDLIHLGRRNDEIPVALDLTTLVCGAACGALAGFVSLVLVQRSVRERFGAQAAWVVAVVTLTLASFGIYLGRVVRVNSWDVVTRPRLLVEEIGERLSDPLAYPRMLAGTAAVTLALLGAYLLFYRAVSALDHRRR